MPFFERFRANGVNYTVKDPNAMPVDVYDTQHLATDIYQYVRDYVDQHSDGGMKVRTYLDGELEPNTRYVLTDYFSSGYSPVFLFPYSANDGDVIELNWENTYGNITYSDNVSELLQFGNDEPYCQIRAVYDAELWYLSKVGRMDETDPTVPTWAKRSTKPTYTASEVGAVPTSRTVNGKALSSNVSLNASDVGAVPNSRTVNGKPLTANINLSADDVDALSVDGGTVNGGTQFNDSVGFVGNAYHYGVIIVNENSFGDELPVSGVEGQLFFLKRQ